jgi:hypothetical protein
MFIRLEEGIIGYTCLGVECYVSQKKFVEVQPPMEIDIEEILKEKV